MRSAEQLKRTPAEWARFRRQQRGSGLKSLLDHLAKVRDEEWYRWVVGGRPRLTTEAYEALRKKR